MKSSILALTLALAAPAGLESCSGPERRQDRFDCPAGDICCETAKEVGDSLSGVSGLKNNGCNGNGDRAKVTEVRDETGSAATATIAQDKPPAVAAEETDLELLLSGPNDQIMNRLRRLSDAYKLAGQRDRVKEMWLKAAQKFEAEGDIESTVIAYENADLDAGILKTKFREMNIRAAQKFAQKGDYDSAISAYIDAGEKDGVKKMYIEKARSLRPTDVKGKIKLFQKATSDEAEFKKLLVEEAERLEQQPNVYYYNIVELYLFGGRPDKARETYKKEAQRLEQKGDLLNAIDLYKQAGEVEDVERIESKIDVQYKQEVRKANKLLLQKAQREAKHGHFWDAARDFRSAGDKASAAKMMKKDTEQRVKVALEQGDFNRAAEIYKDSEPEKARNFLRQAARQAAKEGNYRRASDLYRVADDGVNAVKMLDKAMLQERQQREKEAEEIRKKRDKAPFKPGQPWEAPIPRF